MKEREILEEYERSSSWVWEKNKHKSKTTSVMT